MLVSFSAGGRGRAARGEEKVDPRVRLGHRHHLLDRRLRVRPGSKRGPQDLKTQRIKTTFQANHLQ